ncbi:MAG: S-layer homology domain-containing protein [Candidatus Ornithomonoglobus sp.]
MANGLKKIIAVMSASAIAISMAPMALADADDTVTADIEIQSAAPDENGVYYNEDFSGFSGTVVDMTPGNNSADFSGTNGMTFSCRSRDAGDYAQQGITASSGALTLYANKYVGVGTIQPTITLNWTKGVNFTSDRVLTFKIKFGTVTTSVAVADSAENTITLAMPEGVTTSDWISYTVASTDNGTAVVAEKADGTLLSYSNSSTVLADFATISAPENAAFNFSVDDLNIADADYTLPDSVVLEAAMNSMTILEGQLGMTTEDGYYTIQNNISLPADPDGTTVEWELSQRAIDDTSAAWEATTFASIEDGRLIVAPTPDSASYYVKASAIITAGSESGTKEFLFVVKPILATDPINYYTEDFSGFADGTLVSVQASASGAANSSYSAKGFLFSCGTRASGGSGETGISIATDKYLDIFATKYDDDGSRTPVVELTNTEGITIRDGNKLVFNADVQFVAGSTTSGMILKDSIGGSVTFTADAGVWYNVTYVFGGSEAECLVRDADGNIISYSKGMSNLSDITYITITPGNSGHCYINNLNISDELFEITDSQIAQAVEHNLEIDTTQDSVLVNSDSTYTVINDFSLPTSSVSDANVAWAVTQGDGEETTYASVSGNRVVIDPAEGVEKNKYTLTATITYGETVLTKSFQFSISSPQSIVDAAAENVDLAYADMGAPKKVNGVYTVTKDLLLQTSGDNTTTVAWSTTDTGRVTTTGVIYPNDSDDTITLTATISFRDASTTKEFVVSIPNAVTAYIDPVIEALTVSNADDTTITYPIGEIGTVATDIKLPTTVTKINDASFDGSVKIEWTTDSTNATINNGIVEYTTSDFDAHDITLTGIFTYVKNDRNVVSKTPDSYTYKVQFPESAVESSDAAYDKYKVRFDAAYESNFSGIPTTTSASITLPVTGKFGSTFTWNSSVPTTLSNSGVYSKPSTTKSVVMTASIISGAESTEKQFKITVPGSSSSSGGGGGGGGSTSSTGTTSSSKSSGSVATSTTTAVAGSTGVNGAEVVEKLLEEAAQANDAFTDISSATWAREAINGLAAAGVINGKSETEFAPNDTVTRAEFAKMLMGAFGLNSESFTTSSFGDVSTDAWYFQAVETAYNLGIITGIDDGVFAPDALITRQDMAVMVSRAAAVTGKDIPETVEAKSFDDASSISSYAVNAVDQLVKGGIINGMSDTEFAPLSNATRAQAAKILYSFL